PARSTGWQQHVLKGLVGSGASGFCLAPPEQGQQPAAWAGVWSGPNDWVGRKQHQPWGKIERKALQRTRLRTKAPIHPFYDASVKKVHRSTVGRAAEMR